jgi:hypothetical protein
MAGQNERNCQIRMSPSLWKHVGEMAQEFGYQDRRGGHSPLIREVIATAVAKWVHSPYVCKSASHTVLVTDKGDMFYRQVQTLHLNFQRERLPSGIEMKQEKRDYYHQRYFKLRQESQANNQAIPDELEWFQSRWLMNFLAVWNGRLEACDISSFRQEPLSSKVDSFGPTYKSADLEVHAMAGRFLTREITVGLQDYVQWKNNEAPTFDRLDIPIDIPTTNLEVCVVIDKRLFASLGVEAEAIANLALEFRNRESARFEGLDVATRYRGVDLDAQPGRSGDEGEELVRSQIACLESRVIEILETKNGDARQGFRFHNKDAIISALKKPKDFLFYLLRWPAPQLGIEVCVRWEKPVKME